MRSSRLLARLLILSTAAVAAACSTDIPTSPARARVPTQSSAQGGTTLDPIATVGVAGTWKGNLVAGLLPMGYERWELRLIQLTDTSFYGTGRVAIPQTDGSTITMSEIPIWGKNVGPDVSMTVYIGNSAQVVGTVSVDGKTLTASWQQSALVGTLTVSR